MLLWRGKSLRLASDNRVTIDHKADNQFLLYVYHFVKFQDMISLLRRGLGECCRISPLCFLAECRKRRLHQEGFVLLYFALIAFSELYLIYFPESPI